VHSARDQFVGGMPWLTAKENQIWDRTDPTSGDKKAVSLEGRTAETKAIHDSFMIGRAELRPAMAESLAPGRLRSRS
jgi:hypothetical protein